MTSCDDVVDHLHRLLASEGQLAGRVERSLREAARRSSDLRPALRDALPWPEDLDAYEQYLRGFVRWIPQQSGADAWEHGPEGRQRSEEVSDRLAHFFFLVDQDTGDGESSIAEDIGAFADWLTLYARAWGDFLDTPESFDEDILASFLERAPQYTIEESLIDGEPNQPSGWRTFNQFFARELNPGLRPVAEPQSNLVATSPADCSFRRTFPIGSDSAVPDTTIKGLRTFGTIPELLRGSRHAESFAGGTFAHYMLPPSAYHRFHLPVGGHVDEAFVVQGRVYMEVDLEDGELASKDAATTGYEFTQTRGVITIDTTGSPAGDVGVVGVVAVGMSHVASVRLTAKAGLDLPKGAEFGYFQFGGSDIILLFQAHAAARVDEGDAFRHVGTAAAALTRASCARRRP